MIKSSNKQYQSGQHLDKQLLDRQHLNRQSLSYFLWQISTQKFRVFGIIGRLLSILLVGLTLSVSAWSHNFESCTHHFYSSTKPDYINQSLLNKSNALCFNGFATLYSGISRTPLWSAEHLTKERLYRAEEIPRDDSFHRESRLPKSRQAQLSDYKGTGYDRGHLAPNADMANIEQQYDSFSLANMIPQAPRNNRYVWRNLESVTRYLTKKHGELYVITGVVFDGKSVQKLNDRVIVPTHVFKAIYIPTTQEAAAYYAPNDDTERVEVISIDELALRSGIDAFPAISSTAKSTVAPLATSVGAITDKSTAPDIPDEEEMPLWLEIIVEILRWIVQSIQTN